MKKPLLKRFLIFSQIILLFFLAGCDSLNLFNSNQSQTTASADSASLTLSAYGLDESQIESLLQTANDESTVVASGIVMPSTVEITAVISYSYTRTSYSPWGTQNQTVESSTTSMATGFFINADGYLLTNAHVVTLPDYESATDFKYTGWDITLNYADSTDKFTASIVDYDSTLDLAILKLDQPIANLSYVTFFSLTDPHSDQYNTDQAVTLFYGEPIIAVGNANGYGISVTSGVVSAPIRYFENGNIVTEAIQTDAAINAGNSGGPLANMWGQIVGINSFKIVTSTTENLGYAIPTNVVLNYIDSVAGRIQYHYATVRSYDTANILARYS